MAATQVTPVGNGAAVHWASASSVLVPLPAGIQRGDLIVLQVRANSDTVVEEWSPGVAGFRRRAFDSFAGGSQWIYTRLAEVDGIVGNVQVDFSGTSAKSARMYLFRGNRGDTFVDLQVATGTGNTILHDDVRAHASGRFAIALVSYASTSAASAFGGESGGAWVERAEASSGSGGNRLIQLQTAQMTTGTVADGSFNVTSPGRWIVHTLALAPQAAAQSNHLRVSVEDPDGVMRDMRTLAGKDWQLSASYEHNIDAPVSSATVTLFRADNPTLSLATLVVASTLNRNALGQYAPFLHASRRITIEAAVIESAVSEPFADEWRLVFSGYIDRVDTGGNLIITVQARDLGSVLQTEWVKEVTTYGDDGGAKTAHAVIQDILNDWITTPPTLFVPTAPVPPVLIHEYQQQKMSVMDAIKAVATGHGWDVRYLFDENTGQWRLTYFEPERNTTELAGAFTADDYTIVDSLAIGVEDIRNDGSVIYTDGVTGEPAQVTDDDPVSIAKWGGLRRFFEFEFGTDSPIDTAGEATSLLDGALSDLSEPFAEQQVTFPFNPDVNIGRLYEFLPNDEQYDEPQRFSPSLVRHELGVEDSTTTAFMRGKVAGQFKAWLRNEKGTGPPKDGVDGLTTEFRFHCSATQPGTPSGNDPAGWTTQPPTCSLPSVLWQSSAQRSARTGSVVGDWTTPVRVTGPQGEEGPEGPEGPQGADGTIGPRITFIRPFLSDVSADIVIGLAHSENLGGILEVWVNPSGVTSPNRQGPADGAAAILSTPTTVDQNTTFGGAGQLLNNIPVASSPLKTIYARFTDPQGRFFDHEHTILGVVQVDDPFGILMSVDPGGVVERWALRLVTNPNLAERAVSFRNLVIGSYDNLISDPSFEAAGVFQAGGETAEVSLTRSGWENRINGGGTWGTTTTSPFAGIYAGIYNRTGQTDLATLGTAGSGAAAITAQQGDKHYFQARVRMSGAGSGGQALVQIVYRDGAGNQLAPHESVVVNLTNSYQTIAVEGAAAPAGTAYVQFRLRVPNSGTVVFILWDDCFARLMVEGTLVVDGAILAKHLSAGSVTTVALAARAARIQNLSIGSLGNMIPDPIFSSGAFGTLNESEWTVTTTGGGTWSISSGTPKVGAFSLLYDRSGQTGTARIRHTLESMEATEGDEFYHRTYVRGVGGSSTGAGVAIVFRDAPVPSGGVVLGTFTSTAAADAGAYALRSVSAVAPAGTTVVDFELRVLNNGTATFIRFDDCYAQHMVGGTLIVDGAIQARHIDVLTLEVGQFMQSADYIPGSSGWFLGFDGSDDGFLEISKGVVRTEIASTSFTGAAANFSGLLTVGQELFDTRLLIDPDFDTDLVRIRVDDGAIPTFALRDLILDVRDLYLKDQTGVVTSGADDSAGAGFKVLRVPNAASI